MARSVGLDLFTRGFNRAVPFRVGAVRYCRRELHTADGITATRRRGTGVGNLPTGACDGSPKPQARTSKHALGLGR